VDWFCPVAGFLVVVLGAVLVCACIPEMATAKKAAATMEEKCDIFIQERIRGSLTEPCQRQA
jgi:hypothetical protein